MPNLPLKIPPGIVKVDSPNAAAGRYTDSDKVRFVKGHAEKWLGWQPIINDTVTGKARGAIAWVNQYGNINAAIGTHLKLYVVTGADTLFDITPIRATGTLGADPFETTDTETTVTVTHTSHGLEDLAFVTFSGASAVGGITIDGEYQIAFVDNNTYTIEHSSAATSSATGGGASVAYSYQINPGVESTVIGTGWGAGTWGSGTWGTARTDGISTEARVWFLQEYGNDLLAAPLNGRLYLWEEATDTEAELVTNSPSSMRAMFVTGERYVIALGTTTAMTLQWPDVDDITDWTPSATNTANIKTLQSGSRIMNGTALVDGLSLIWTDTSIYVLQFTGNEFIYDARLVGDAAGLVAPLAFAKHGGMAFWMSQNEFHMFNGSVQGIPNSEDVSAWVFDNINRDQIGKTWAMYDASNGQVRWHYCHGDATEPNRYVDVTVGGSWDWTVGTIDRTTGARYRTSDATNFMVSSDGTIYVHEVTSDDNGSAMEAYISYGMYVLARGETNVDIMGIIPDCQRQIGDLSFEVTTYDRPNSTTVLDTSTTTLSPGDEIADIRVEGRHFTMTVRSNEVGGDFRLGDVSLETQSSGARR